MCVFGQNFDNAALAVIRPGVCRVLGEQGPDFGRWLEAVGGEVAVVFDGVDQEQEFLITHDLTAAVRDLEAIDDFVVVEVNVHLESPRRVDHRGLASQQQP